MSRSCMVCMKVVLYGGVNCGHCSGAWHKYCFNKQLAHDGGRDVKCHDCGVVVEAPFKLSRRGGSEKSRVVDLLPFRAALHLPHSPPDLPTYKDVIRAANYVREISPSYSNLMVAQDVAR